MDYGKYLYQQEKREREAKKHQHQITVKEVKFRINVDDHDYETKKNHVLRFLGEGDKVKATIFFRGREMTRQGLGRGILDRLIKDLGDKAVVEFRPRQEGNTLHLILAPPKVQPPAKPAGAKAGEAGPAATAAPASAAATAAVEPPFAFHGSLFARVERIPRWPKLRLLCCNRKITMPKLKTHSGAAKRFKKTGTGKIKRGHAFKRHILTSKGTKRKRQLDTDVMLDKADQNKIARMIPY